MLMLKLFVLKPEMIQLDMEYTFLIDMYGYKNPKRNMIMNFLNNYLIGETKIEYYPSKLRLILNDFYLDFK